MGRPRAGWRLRPPKGKRTKFAVVFTWGGREVERSCSTEDRDVAETVAARIYADHVTRHPDSSTPRKRRAGTSPRDLGGLVSRWLVDHAAVVGSGTIGSYSLYWETHLLPHFERIENITEITCQEYRNARLRRVTAATVRKEQSALRGFVAWASERGFMREVTVAPVPKRAQGTRHELAEGGRRMRGKALILSPDEVSALIEELPDWTKSTHTGERIAVRPRFVVGYELGLRPAVLDRIEVPRHWEPKRTRLLITEDIDKGGWERSILLTRRARSALELAVTNIEPPAPLFGFHNYRRQLKNAADAVLKRGGFAGGHLRHNRITHLLEKTGNLPGVQFVAGHRNTGTTARYVRPTERAGDAVLSGRRR